MPLFFLLAGAAAWFALGKRIPRQFAGERFLRLFVPLIFGMLVIVPPQVYFERIFDGDFAGSFIAWYPNTFRGTYNNDRPDGNLSWHHLWFLAYLFTFSLLLLPLFRYLRQKNKEPLIARIAGFMEKPGAIFIPAVPLALINLVLRPIYGYGNQNLIADWANLPFYASVFFYGFLMVSDKRLMQVVHRNRFTALIAAVACIVVIYTIETDILTLVFAEPLLLVLYAFASWCSLIAIAGIGRQLLNFSNRLLRYASDAVLPVYILHQTLIITIGFYLTQWKVALEAKYFIVSIGTLLSALAIYEVVRRISVTRFLFGIKTKKRSE